MNDCAFVAGATGLTGGAVVRHLLRRGVRAVAHVRPDSPRRREHRARFEELGASIDTTPWDEAAMTETLRELAPRVVFALLGTTRKRAREAGARGWDASNQSYEAVDYGLTALLRRAAEASGHRPRFVYLSAVGVDPRKDTASRYMQAKVRVERELLLGALPYTVLRPSFISGDREESRRAESVGMSVADGILAVAGALGAKRTRDRYRSITGDALGRACVRLALDPAAAGGVFESDSLRA